MSVGRNWVWIVVVDQPPLVEQAGIVASALPIVDFAIESMAPTMGEYERPPEMSASIDDVEPLRFAVEQHCSNGFLLLSKAIPEEVRDLQPVREVELMPLPGQPWPLREDIRFSPGGQVVFTPSEYGLSDRLTHEIVEWLDWWVRRDGRSDATHVAWAQRIVRDLERELGEGFRVTYYPEVR